MNYDKLKDLIGWFELCKDNKCDLSGDHLSIIDRVITSFKDIIKYNRKDIEIIYCNDEDVTTRYNIDLEIKSVSIPNIIIDIIGKFKNEWTEYNLGIEEVIKHYKDGDYKEVCEYLTSVCSYITISDKFDIFSIEQRGLGHISTSLPLCDMINIFKYYPLDEDTYIFISFDNITLTLDREMVSSLISNYPDINDYVIEKESFKKEFSDCGYDYECKRYSNDEKLYGDIYVKGDLDDGVDMLFKLFGNIEKQLNGKGVK